MEPKRFFEFCVEGQYYGYRDESGTPAIKKYVAKFILPSQESALSIICKHLLDPYLKKHYEDYIRFRTHQVTSIVTNGRLPDPKVLQMDFDDMDVRDLSDFCILKQIFIDPYRHKELELCREEVKHIYHLRLAQQKADKASGQTEKQLEVNALRELNQLPIDDGTEVNVNMQKLKRPRRPVRI